MSRLKAIADHGQSIWLDYIRRDFVDSNALRALIAEDGLKGITSNPAIFEKAIGGSGLYDAAIEGHLRAGQRSPEQLVDVLAVEDIRMAADAFSGVYHDSKQLDGYVSLEVSPRIANDAARTLDEARRLWRTVGRPNLMVKVPGTEAGIAVLRALTAEGINVNVTLLFSRTAYAAVAEAYLKGLEDRVAKGEAIDRIASVASFFVSRIDTAVDALLGADGDAVAGKVAIANARLAYQDFLTAYDTPRWQALAARQAMPQRLLWASTGTKNPAFGDTLYVEQLIGPATVNTVPPATLDAFRDHGKAARTLDADVAGARAIVESTESLLAARGSSLEAITTQLTTDGLKLFADAWAQLMQSVAAKRDALEAADKADS